jgi:hypothetical protein
MAQIPASFLFRVSYPCLQVPGFPRPAGDDLLDLPVKCTLPEMARLQEKPGFAEVRIAWNEAGLGFEVRVKGKDRPVRGEPGKYRTSDGLSLWIDTRSARDSHRATRYCHHFFFLAAGGGEYGDLPVAGQTKIHRALADAPQCRPDQLRVRKHNYKDGYRLECFLPQEVLHGFDVELNNRFGFFYVVRDGELGEQSLGLGPEFPYAEDPSLWQILELQRK